MGLPPLQPPTPHHRRFKDGRANYTLEGGADEQQFTSLSRALRGPGLVVHFLEDSERWRGRKEKTASYCIHLPLILVHCVHSFTQEEEVLAIITTWKEERRIIRQKRKDSN